MRATPRDPGPRGEGGERGVPSANGAQSGHTSTVATAEVTALAPVVGARRKTAMAHAIPMTP